MVSGTVAVRLPDKVLEELERRATAENKKVSELVRELIISGLSRRQADSNAESNAQVIEYLQGFGGVLMGILFQTAEGHYFAKLATSYATDMESLMRQGIPMDKEAKTALMRQFEAAAKQTAQTTWARVLRMEQETVAGQQNPDQ